MENLYEIKNRKEKIINQFSNEHDWEIGYQKFYEFLRNEFYNFIKNILNRYSHGNISSLDNLKDESITLTDITMINDFIRSFVLSNQLGEITYNFVDGNETLTIKFDSISFEKLLNSFYNEIQSIEYNLKSPEKMAEELSNFKNTNQEWIEEKQLRQHANNDYAEYFDILMNTINNTKDRVANNNETFYEYIMVYVRSEKTIDCIFDFMMNYHLGECFYFDGCVSLKFTATLNELIAAYDKEIDRLNYSSENKAR